MTTPVARYLLSLEPDRMLALYRQRAGLEPPEPGQPRRAPAGRSFGT